MEGSCSVEFQRRRGDARPVIIVVVGVFIAAGLSLDQPLVINGTNLARPLQRGFRPVVSSEKIYSGALSGRISLGELNRATGKGKKVGCRSFVANGGRSIRSIAFITHGLRCIDALLRAAASRCLEINITRPS